MEKKSIGVRDVDEETFRKFRALAIERRIKLGEAITLAMKKLLQEEQKIIKEKNIKALLGIKPFSWGKGTERTSEEVDKILYGE